MQRKAYVPGVAALLAALLAGCTGSSSGGDTTDNSNPGQAGTATAAAEPGKYRTLPEPCGAIGHSTLDSLLPGIKQLTDAEQKEQAYAGEATQTFDTDRKVGCGWKVESTDATDHLSIDFERVVSYDTTVSDATQAQQLFAEKETAADLPAVATSSESATSDVEVSSSASPSDSASPSGSASTNASASGSASPSATPSDLQPRLLDDLGDEAFLDDALSSSGSTAQQRTVTVAFRTSNVIVTIEYVEQPATVGVAPDSKGMQDKARKLASQLADSLAG
ncbi:DUF3558 domain-containing protein [Streptomyces fulvoviolaceus]|uniref:DUF3558 domain-containing protein n=1 Tax=Streptomyces fulvoviolaceus TaxID=285535 RepID=UPI0021BFBD83|nr:DUF3558 domain-containing protein [Streptomyces fulvoviolaceus]MCT9077531.1 DUF3558 domain-containing protein [Streptomyces fulvoviolaceus]